MQEHIETVWVVSVRERSHDLPRTYLSPPHASAADARVLAAIILCRSQLIGEGPWHEAIAGGQRTVSLEHTCDGRPF